MKRMAAVLLALLVGVSPVVAGPRSPEVKLLESDGQRIVVELTIPHCQVIPRVNGSTTYHSIVVPGLEQTWEPGKPQVPHKGVLLGVPSSGRVKVSVLQSAYETRRGLVLYPSPWPILRGEGEERFLDCEFALDVAAYGRNAFYPGPLAEIGFSGYLRDQRVLQLRLYPFQYNPVSRELRCYSKLRVGLSISSEGREETGTRGGGFTAFERFLATTVFNYQSLKPQIRRSYRVQGFSPHEHSGGTKPDDRPGMLKIGVEEKGLYRLTPAQLQDAGIELTEVDPRTIKIIHGDCEIPIHVHGEEDGVFDGTDYIEFYGLAMTGPFTVRNVYWLTTGGGNGLRMPQRYGAPDGIHATLSCFHATLHAEEDHVYWQNIPGDGGQDHWFWRGPLEAPTATTLTFDLHHLATEEGKDATLRVGLRGRTDDRVVDPDHHTRVSLNGVEIDDALWDGQIGYHHEVTVPQSVLAEGINTLTVESVGDTGARVDSIYLNCFEVDYWDTFVAENDQLEFRQEVSGTYQFTVTDFSEGDVSIFDISDPANVARVVDPAIEVADDTYTVKFQDTIEGQARYLALTSAQRKTPVAIAMDQPSDLRSPNNGADYVIITHDDFYESVLPLANYRQSKGLWVKTVTVTDIYDEFNYGIFNPDAIRDFLSYAYHHWAVAPLYVLLVGDANLDFKDNLGTGRLNTVPTHIFETWPLGETPSDNWFVCVSGDDILPDMFIGRICAQRPEDVEAVVEKIIGYERNPPPGDWNGNGLFVADDDQTDFEAISQHLIDLLPAGYRAQRVYAREYESPANPTADIVRTIDDGALLVNYVGHGFTDRWGTWSGGRIFDRSRIASLDNGGKLPLLTTATCLNGFFPHPLEDYSLAEEFLRVQGKGAIAAWSPTGLGFPSQHRLLFGELFTAIFEEDNRLLGPATTAAKISAYAEDSSLEELVETFVLFGDPALELNPFDAPLLARIYLPLVFKANSLSL